METANGQIRHITANDAQILLRLYEIRIQSPLREARHWFETSFSVQEARDFDRLWATDDNARTNFRLVLSYWEMCCSMVITGALHPELFFQNAGELLYVWQKIQVLVHETRQTRKNPLSCQNMERVARAYISWLDGKAPEALPAMKERIYEGR